VLLETLWRRKHAAGVVRGASLPRTTGARRPVHKPDWNVNRYSADGALLALVVVRMRQMKSNNAVNERAITRRRTRTEDAACIAIALSMSACGGAPRVIALVRASGGTLASMPSGGVPLDVVSRSAAVVEPLPVRGSDVGYGDLQTALGVIVTTATASWASVHRDDVVARQGGWTLLVELTGADALLEAAGRVVVSLDVRATMRTRSGNVYLGQTQLGCREGGPISSGDGAPVVYRCLTRVGRDLAGWLSGGVRLEPPPDS
jgi:hypothetical protein